MLYFKLILFKFIIIIPFIITMFILIHLFNFNITDVTITFYYFILPILLICHFMELNIIKVKFYYLYHYYLNYQDLFQVNHLFYYLLLVIMKNSDVIT